MKLSVTPKDINEEVMNCLRATDKAESEANFTPHKQIPDK